MFQFKDRPESEQVFRVDCFSAEGVYTLIEGNTCMLNLDVDSRENRFPVISLGPNPTSGFVQVNLETISSDLLVNVYTIDGQLLGSFAERNTNRLQVPLDSGKGLYLIEILSDDNRSVQKVVKV